jgi:hypothetical protein
MRRILYILGVISLLVMSLPYPVQATTAILTVTGEGGYTEGTYSGLAVNYTNMQSDDGGTSVLGAGAAASYTHTWAFSAAPTASSITSLTINIKSYGTADLVGEVEVGGTLFPSGSVHVSSGTYTTFTMTWTTNPATGLPWTNSSIAAAKFGYNASNFSGLFYVTYITITMDYSPASPPSMTTSSASPIGVTTATLNGEVATLNGANVTSEGFVWDTASHTPLASNNVTPGNGYALWWYQNGTYGVGAFSHAITGLTSGQTYYYRACANNTYGWNYGAELNFTTIGIPSITTVAASSISTVTAQLNANVANSNGQPCDVRFGFDNVSHAGTFAYANLTAWVNDTYTTGMMPYVSLSGLNVVQTYYFNVQIENDAGIAYGTEMSFTTYSGLNPPTNFIAIPNSNSIVLSWSKDPSSVLTEVKWSTSTYPNTTADGVLLYLGPLSSTVLTNVTIGTTIFFSAWGASGGLFSTAKAITLGTTTAGTVTIPPVVPTSPTSMWIAMPSELGLINFPLYSYFNIAFDAYSMPRATGWVLLFMGLTLILGMVIYMKAPSNNLLLTGVFIGIMMSWGTLIGMPTNCLIPIWATLAYWIMFITIATVANRY